MDADSSFLKNWLLFKYDSWIWFKYSAKGRFDLNKIYFGIVIMTFNIRKQLPFEPQKIEWETGFFLLLRYLGLIGFWLCLIVRKSTFAFVWVSHKQNFCLRAHFDIFNRPYCIFNILWFSKPYLHIYSYFNLEQITSSPVEDSKKSLLNGFLLILIFIAWICIKDLNFDFRLKKTNRPSLSHLIN